MKYKNTKHNNRKRCRMYAVSRQIKNNKRLKQQLELKDDYLERMYVLERYLEEKRKHALWRNWLVDKTYYKQEDTAPRCRRMEITNLSSLLDQMQTLIKRYAKHNSEEDEYITRLCEAIVAGKREPATLERLRFALAYYFAEVDAYNYHAGNLVICERSRLHLHHLFQQVCELLGITYDQLETLAIEFKHLFEILEKQGEQEAQIATLVISYFTHYYLEAGFKGEAIMNKHLTNAGKYFRFGAEEQAEFNTTLEELEQVLFMEILCRVQLYNAR